MAEAETGDIYPQITSEPIYFWKRVEDFFQITCPAHIKNNLL